MNKIPMAVFLMKDDKSRFNIFYRNGVISKQLIFLT